MNSSFFPPTFNSFFSIVFVIVFSIKMLLEKNPFGYNCTLYGCTSINLNVVAILVASMSSKISIS